jgi:hypothetical protein
MTQLTAAYSSAFPKALPISERDQTTPPKEGLENVQLVSEIWQKISMAPETPAKTNTSYALLPTSLISYVLRYLTNQESALLRRTCSPFRHCYRNDGILNIYQRAKKYTGVHIKDADLLRVIEDYKLSGCSMISSLCLTRCSDLTDKFFIQLNKIIPSLVHLNLSIWKITKAALGGLQGLGFLQTLKLHWECGISGKDLPQIGHLPSLNSLDLFPCKDMDSALPWIKEQSSLTQLDLSCGDATKEGLALLKELPCLAHLDLSSTYSGEGDQLAGLQGLRSLLFLNLFNCNSFKAKGFTLLKDLPSLKELDVSCCPLIFNEGLIALSKQIPSLEKLNLKSCFVSDEGVVQLRNLRFLKELNLSETLISDVCLPRLAELPLESLDIRKCYSVTDDGVDKLQEARPNLKIIRKSEE